MARRKMGNFLKKIKNDILKFALSAVIVGNLGCTSAIKTDSDLESKIVSAKKSTTGDAILGLAYLPVAWFAGVAAHEGVHGLAAYAFGAESVNVSFPFSYRDRDGDGRKTYYVAEARYKGDLNNQERITFLSAGPAVNFYLVR